MTHRAPLPPEQPPGPPAAVPSPAAGYPEAAATSPVVTVPEAPHRAHRTVHARRTRRTRRTRRALVVGLAAGLVLLAVGSGAGYAAITLAGADHTTPTRVWQEPREQRPPFGDTGRSRGKSGEQRLADRLLPLPDGYALGPDMAEFGNDTVLSGKRAVALLKQGGRELPPEQRRRQSEAVDSLRVKGVAMRSYSTTYGKFVAEMQITQLDNHSAGSALSRFHRRLIEALGVFRKGPAIKGHRNASCFLLPKSSGKGLDMMFCTAYEDGLLVTMKTYGRKPLDTEEAGGLLRKQLDHVNSPGEYV